mgnify:CR=1 FL=1
MKEQTIKILAIESSCDETAAAVITETTVDGRQTTGQERKSSGSLSSVGNRPVILSNIVSSQIDLHAKTGGVVPEVASRAHMEAIMPVIQEALETARETQELGNRLRVTKPVSSSGERYTAMSADRQAGKRITATDTGIVTVNRKPSAMDLFSDLTHIAVTNGPGLIGSLLVGFNAAKSLAYAKDLPVIPINHIEGHIFSALCAERQKAKVERQIYECMENYQYPLLALVVSGGHTSLIYAKSEGKYQVIGETLDDAAGEAFDKVAKLLKLGYPGGPKISKKAMIFRQKNISGTIIFPRPLLKENNFNFSFSGLKTAVLREVIDSKYLDEDKKQEISAAFEDAVVDVLVSKSMKAYDKLKPNTFVLAGGVSANEKLRKTLDEAVFKQSGKRLLIPPLSLCGDNAAMIGIAAYYHIKRDDIAKWNEINIDSNAEL